MFLPCNIICRISFRGEELLNTSHDIELITFQYVIHYLISVVWYTTKSYIIITKSWSPEMIYCLWLPPVYRTDHNYIDNTKTGNPLINTLRSRQNGRHFADDTFKCIFMNENVRISINISLKFVPKGLINNIPALVQIMAWRRRGNKPLSESMMVRLPTHICITLPQWVKIPCNLRLLTNLAARQTY